MRVLIASLLAMLALAQEQAPVPIGPGVTPPRLIHPVEPAYTSAASKAGAQGTVLLKAVVDAQGKIGQVEVISPLAFGLEQKAIEAVLQWKFEAGRKDGKPVPIIVTVQINFHPRRGDTVSIDEERRTQFNLAVSLLSRNPPFREVENLGKIAKLARQKYGPALYYQSRRTNDPAESLSLLQAAAKEEYGPALYDLSKRRMNGEGVPKDSKQGIELLRNAAERGHIPAQFTAGLTFERGGVVPKDEKLARGYFRLCAAKDESQCQFHLGKLMLDMPNRRDSDYEQAMAWLKLAATRELAPAKALFDIELPNLTDTQQAAIDKLVPQLVPK